LFAFEPIRRTVPTTNTKINSCLKKALLMKKEQEYERAKKADAGQEAR